MNAPYELPVPKRTMLETHRDGFAIGQILIDAGYLDLDAAETVARAQRQNGLSFGEAALRLKMLRPEAIEFALAQQFEHTTLHPSDDSVSSEVVTAFLKEGPFIEQMRSLRTRLMLARAARSDLPASIAIHSAVAGEGRSFVASNLAVVFAQLGERTLLIDADMRTPSQHKLFSLPRVGLSNLLMGRAGLECITKVPNFFALSVLAAGTKPPNPQELLSRARLEHLLHDALINFDVIIVDTPPTSSYADALIVGSKVGMSVMVSRAGSIDQFQLAHAQGALRDAGANIVGAILNQV